MDTRDAVLRLLQEVAGFTDRPDYIMPLRVRAAFDFLMKEFKFEKPEPWCYPDEGLN